MHTNYLIKMNKIEEKDITIINFLYRDKKAS